MRVIPVGYGDAKHRDLIARLMQDETMLLVDTRISPRSAVPGWHRTSLERRYGNRFVWFGSTLGNLHYKQPELGIAIVDLESGLTDLIALLRQRDTLLLLCGCGAYEKCHRRVICDALLKCSSEIEIVLPEMIIAQEVGNSD